MFKKTVMGFALLAAHNSMAAEAPKNVEEEILVTATRTEQPVFKSLASVSVLTEEDIRKAQAPSILELLGSLPGIDTRHNGGRGSQSSIYVRGTEADHVLILVDGIRTAGATNGTTALQSIPVENIERIEVVRGPRSSLYGAEAIGGVIQVFTKKGTESAQTAVSTEYGSHDLTKSTISSRGKLGNTLYSVSGIYEQTSGIDRTIKDGTANDDRDGYREKAWAASLVHSFDSGVEAGIAINRNDSEVDFDGGGKDYTETVIESRSGYIAIPFTEDLQLRLNAARFRDTRETFGTVPDVFETIRDSYGAQLDYSLTEDHLVSVGYDYYNDEVDAQLEFTVKERYNKAAFIQYQGRFDRVSATASVRKDNNEAFGNEYTRSFSVGYDLSEDTLISLSYGTAFKAPTFNDLYYPSAYYVDGWSAGVDFEYVGNPDLVPEESESLELMLRSRTGNINWSASVYKTKIENLIDFNTVFTPTLVSYAPDNISKAEILGGELEASFSALGFSVISSLSYADPRNEDTDDMLPGRARGKAAIDISRDFGEFEVILAWQAQSHRFRTDGRRSGGYNTVDLRANYQVTPKLVVSAKVENLFDKHYRLDPKFETEGQTASVSARYTF
jgi:vitamin B12 transporter